MSLQIEQIINLIPDWQGKSIIVNPLDNGITNFNFEIVVDNKSFFLSKPSPKSELLNIDYNNKYFNNKICGEFNLSPNVIYFIESEKLLITEFIESKTFSIEHYQNTDEIKQIIKQIKRLHNTKPFLKNFDMLNLIRFYQKILKNQLIPQELTQFIQKINLLEKKLFLPNHQLVPCHNDLVPENILNKNNQLFIIDFDYSGNNDPCFELGNLSVEMDYNNDQIDKLIKFYFGEIKENIVSRVNLQGVLSDIGWTLWSYVQLKESSIDFDYKGYAQKRFERVINKIESNEFNYWIDTI